jgi:hypothetical protein
VDHPNIGGDILRMSYGVKFSQHLRQQDLKQYKGFVVKVTLLFAHSAFTAMVEVTLTLKMYLGYWKLFRIPLVVGGP